MEERAVNQYGRNIYIEKSERVEVFEGLLALVEQYRRVNQYQ